MIATEHVSVLLLRHWDALGQARPAAAGFSYVLVTKGSEPVSKLVLLAFPRGEAVPRVAVKLARSKAQNASLELEYRNLRAVASFGAYGRVVTPTPLVGEEEDGWVWLAESVVDGTELGEDALSPAEPVVTAVVDWLVHLGVSTLGLASTTAGADDLLDLLACAERHVTTSEERRVLDRTAAHLRTLAAGPIPRVFEQRDMGPWNLLLSNGGTIGVLDWESSHAGGFPAWDLFYFVAHCGFMVDRSIDPGDRMRSFEHTFWGHHGFASTARAALRRYARGLGLREEWLGPLSAACWLHHTISEVTRLGIRPSASLFWRMLTATLERDCRLRGVA